MPKFSVSVPDDLWNRARESTDVEGASHLIQLALSSFVASRPAPFQADDDQVQALKRLADAKRIEAAALFQQGYAAGLELAAGWPFELIDWAAQLNFDLERLRDELELYYSGEFEEVDFEGDLVRLGFEGGRGTFAQQGARQALVELWKEVRAQPERDDS